MRFSLFMLLRICSSLTLFAVLSSSSALASRVRKDLPSSSNGSNPGKQPFVPTISRPRCRCAQWQSNQHQYCTFSQRKLIPTAAWC